MQATELAVEGVEELLPVEVLPVPLPGVLTVEDHRDQRVGFILARSHGQDRADEVFRRILPLIVLVGESDPVGEFRVAEHEDHLPVTRREDVRRGVRAPGRGGALEHLHVARRQEDPVLRQDRQDLLGDRPLAGPHAGGGRAEQIRYRVQPPWRPARPRPRDTRSASGGDRSADRCARDRCRRSAAGSDGRYGVVITSICPFCDRGSSFNARWTGTTLAMTL